MMELTNGGWRAKIIADSISEVGKRLTTMEVTFPRPVLAEFNTHRMFSRNSASSRAIPIEKMIERARTNPFIPTYWGKNQKGMQAHEELDEYESKRARMEWEWAVADAIDSVEALLDLGVHKQLANRLLEPFMWHTCIVTATEWSNFFALRCHEDAAPEIRNVALLMQKAYDTNKPEEVPLGSWHLPLVYDEDWDILERNIDGPYDSIVEKAKMISVARCARVSYLTHEGKRDHEADITLYNRLLSSRHMSPFEHVARATTPWSKSGNFVGWLQLRKQIPYEEDASRIPKEV